MIGARSPAEGGGAAEEAAARGTGNDSQSPPRGVRLPPRAPLDAVAQRLDRAGIVWALGGSALLHALGLEHEVRDWDLTVDVDVPVAHAALRDLAPALHGNLGIHADHKLVCGDAAVEVICRFAFFGERGVIHVPTRVTGRWEGLPIGSPEAWAVAYTLMIGERPGRAEKAERLFAWIAAHGAHADAIDALLREPLPPELAERLRGCAAPRR